MKKTLIFIALLSALTTCSALCQERRSHTKTYSLLPSATLNITNDASREIEIRSEYPIQLAAGECHSDYTVQWHCSFEKPRDLFIRDLRARPVFRQPRANVITIIASEN